MQGHGIRVEQKLTDNGVPKMPVGPFAKQRVPEFGLVPVEGQRVFIAPSALSTSSEGEPSTCLADLIEPDGEDAVISEAGTAQMLTPSCRRV